MANLAYPRFQRVPAAIMAGALLAACNDPAGSDTPYIVTPATSATLVGTAGWTLTDTLVVEVRDAGGHPVPGATVQWSLPNGGRLEVQSAEADNRMVGTADDRGRNYAVWTLGLPEGPQEASAVSGVGGAPASFTATATVLHAIQVTISAATYCAILPDQRPVCWGDNRHGQLGTGDTVRRSKPTRVAGLAAVQEIRTSAWHTCARDLSGDVWCWGTNWFGEGGRDATQPFQTSPVRVAGAEGAVSLSLSADFYRPFTCAVLSASGAVCWGYNHEGQLGTGDSVSSSSPRQVVGSAGFKTVYSGGDGRSCALDAGGEAWCWGEVYRGPPPPRPSTMSLTPTPPVPGHQYSALAVGAYSVCGIQLDGMASCWGLNHGSLGTWVEPGTEVSGPLRADLNEHLAQISSDGWNGFYARTRFGQGFMWGETNGDVFTILPALITPSLRVEDLSASNSMGYCVIAVGGGVYCAPERGWYQQDEALRGVPNIEEP